LIFRRSIRSEAISLGANDPALLELLGINVEEVNIRGKNGLKEATVYACIRILSEAIAKLPLKVYKEDGGTKKATEHYLYSLLKYRPNPYMSSSDFFRCVEVQRNLYGNAYVNIEFIKRGPDKGKIKALWPLDSAKVTVYIDDKGLFDSKNRMWYVVHINGEERKLQPEEILHFKGLTTDGLVGVAPLDVLKLTIENAASGTTYINNFFKQGLQTKGIVQYVGDLNPEAEKAFRDKFEQMSSGLKNAHRISLLPIGYKFEPISLTLTDAQFLENTQLTIRQIAAAFGVKMHQLNDLERATHTNISEQQRQFYIDTLMAILTSYEQELTYKLLMDSELQEGYYCKFTVDALTRADIKTRYEAYRTGISAGFLTPNEVRAWEELPPAEGGDQLLVNGNVVPIEDAGAAYRDKKGGGGD
jgi:HK97 family phage portal protein